MPARGQNAWTIHAFASGLIAPGSHGPGSMPPSTVRSVRSIRSPSMRTVSVFSDVASTEM